MSYGEAPPPPSYGSAPPPGGAAGGDHPKGTQILIMGILSIVCCQILGPFAAIMGRNTLQEIDASGGNYTNRGMVQAGFICGIIGSVFLVLTIIYLIVVFVIIGSNASEL